MSKTTDTPEVQPIPEDFAAYSRWRDTGELPQTAAAEEETAQQDPPAAEEAETAEDTGARKQEQERKGNPAIEKRMAELTRARREAERRAAEAEERLARIQAGRPAEGNQPAKPAAEPKPEDFKSYDEYNRALISWEIDERERARAERDAKDSRQEVEQARVSTLRERVQSFRSEHDDFDAVVEAAPPVTEVMKDVILESEHQAELMYELAKAPEEIQRIAQLSPLAQARELGKIEARIAAAKTAPEPETPITRAPKPPTPVRSKATVEPSIYDDKLADDYGAWERARNAQLKRR